MMKSLKYILALSLLAICVAPRIAACGPYERESAKELRIYRAASPEDIDAYSNCYNMSHALREDNCRLWNGLLPAPLSDIEKVVYKASLAQLDSLPNGSLASNSFARQLRESKNREHLDFLRLAKQVETVRETMNNPWYFNNPNDREHLLLDSLLQVAQQRHNSSHTSRYMLQEMRILRSLGKYDDIITLWDKNNKNLPNDIIKRMMAQQAAGAYLKKGNRDVAIQLYTDAGDFQSLLLLNQDGNSSTTISPEILELENIMKYDPNSKMLGVKLHNFVRTLENNFPQNSTNTDTQTTDSYDDIDEDYLAYLLEMKEEQRKQEENARNNVKRLRSFCLDNAYKTDNPALLLYTAAYLDYLQGDLTSAAYLLAKAQLAPADDFTKDTLRSFRIILESHHADNTPQYLAKLFDELKWLDQQLADNASYLQNASFMYEWQYNNKMNYSFYYWQDIIRKALLGEVVPRLMQSDAKDLALQLANYACNRIYQIEPKYQISYFKDDKWIEEDITFDEYRYKSTMFNDFDYSNEFFDLAFEQSADTLKEYAASIFNDNNPFSQFLRDRGYNDPDYINELVGTKYLQEMNYPEARKWLKKVSPEYQSRTNLADGGYFDRDPFKLQYRFNKIADNSNYKLNFATKMCELQDSIQSADDPNERAMARFMYATGLRNSFGRCWALTQYGFSGATPDYDYFNSADRRAFEANPHAQKAYEIVDREFEQALNEVTEPDIAAMMNFLLLNNKTLIDKYSDTFAATFIRGRCDNYHDYNIQKL